MKSVVGKILSVALSLILSACGGRSSVNNTPDCDFYETGSVIDEANENTEFEKQEEDNTMKITVGENVFIADFADNSSAEAFKELLEKGSLTIEMHDYGNFEKVGEIGVNLPQNNEQITTEPGDIILYLGNSITIYYDVNSWNFTRIGKIRNVTQKELKKALGEGNVTVTFSL